MEIRIDQIINSIPEKYQVLGDAGGCVCNAHSLRDADENSISFCKEQVPECLEKITGSKARVVICSDKLILTHRESAGKTIIQVANPRLAYCRILAKYFFERPKPAIHPTAAISEKARIGSDVYIGPHSYIGDCRIGDGVIIDGHVHIDYGATIGKRVIIHAGVVIGTEAVAFERNEQGELEWFPQIASAVIEDEVELGANTVVCRGSLIDTVIGRGTKIDNQVRVGHGVKIGTDCVIVGGTVICGSSKIGNRTWVGPMVCIRESVSIGNKVVVGAGSVVHKDIPDNTIVTGSPARPVPSITVTKTY
jgi:UDP-3-O-[3-hydroxymyristoyl] glucosamine N-acyltransferase